MLTACRVVLTLAVAGFVTPALAQELFVYPNSEQTAEQQEKDETACYKWAKKESDFDPMKVPTATSAPPQKTSPSAGRSAVRGAAVGAVAGKITGAGGGKGAAAGAASGGLIGGMRDRDHHRQEQQWAEDQARQYQQRRNRYNRAYAACLEARDYTVR